MWPCVVTKIPLCTLYMNKEPKYPLISVPSRNTNSNRDHLGFYDKYFFTTKKFHHRVVTTSLSLIILPTNKKSCCQNLLLVMNNICDKKWTIHDKKKIPLSCDKFCVKIKLFLLRRMLFFFGNIVSLWRI